MNHMLISPVEDRCMLYCLVHVPSGAIVQNYLELSKILKGQGWRVFMDVSKNVFGAWYFQDPVNMLFPIVTLPLPYIFLATHIQLSTVANAFGDYIFKVRHCFWRNFKELQDYNVVEKPVLCLRDTGEEIVSVDDFARVLIQSWWTQKGTHDFCKVEIAYQERNPVYLPIQIMIPTVTNMYELPIKDLRYIVMFTENIFELRTPTEL